MTFWTNVAFVGCAAGGTLRLSPFVLSARALGVPLRQHLVFFLFRFERKGAGVVPLLPNFNLSHHFMAQQRWKSAHAPKMLTQNCVWFGLEDTCPIFSGFLWYGLQRSTPLPSINSPILLYFSPFGSICSGPLFHSCLPTSPPTLPTSPNQVLPPRVVDLGVWSPTRPPLGHPCGKGSTFLPLYVCWICLHRWLFTSIFLVFFPCRSIR